MPVSKHTEKYKQINTPTLYLALSTNVISVYSPVDIQSFDYIMLLFTHPLSQG